MYGNNSALLYWLSTVQKQDYENLIFHTIFNLLDINFAVSHIVPNYTFSVINSTLKSTC